MSTTDKPKRGPGRPRKPASHRVSEHVATTVTPAERDAVVRTAALCGESVALWARGVIQAALEDAERVPEKETVRADRVLTAAEKDAVRRAAEAQGVPVPVWLRQAIQWALEDAGEGAMSGGEE